MSTRTPYAGRLRDAVRRIAARIGDAARAAHRAGVPF
jgi:hypothetical protein